jgi:hypothetical protein
VRIAPFLVAGFAYYRIQDWVRDHSYEQTIAFSLGTHMFENCVRLAGMIVFPFYIITPKGHYAAQALAASVLGLVVVAVLLLARPRLTAKLFLVAWFLLALLPISTSIYGAEGRKLYSAAAPIAILLGMFGAMLWDRRPQVAGYWAHAGALALVLFASAGMAYRGHQTSALVNTLTTQSKALVTQMQSEHPAVEPDTHVYVRNLPLLLIIFGDSYVRDALRIYYGDIEVTAVTTQEQFDQLQSEIDQNDVVLIYKDPLAVY